MAIVNRAFEGKLNLDANPNRLPASDFSDALNITRDAELSGQDKVVTNVNGNQVVLYSLPAGTNKRIGSKAAVREPKTTNKVIIATGVAIKSAL